MSDMSEEGNLPTKFCDPLENLILSGGEEGGGGISNSFRNGRKGSGLIVTDRYKGGIGGSKSTRGYFEKSKSILS